MLRIAASIGSILLGFGLLATGSCDDTGESILCGPNTSAKNGVCLADPAVCGDGTVFNPVTRQCQPALSCAVGTILLGGECIPDGSIICQNGTRYEPDTGVCVADILGCGAGAVLLGEHCVSEDQARTASHDEAAEPNDELGLAGTLNAPSVAGITSVHGCISPVDSDGEGTIDPDLDSYLLKASGPTLLDISVDGVGGLAGAFVVKSAESGRLADEGWERIGLNLTGDTSRRQVFLPQAGTYEFQVMDGRQLLQAAPVGSESTCYFASLRGIALPAASSVVSETAGLLSGDAIFLAYTPGSDGEFIRDSLAATSGSARPALVHMREGQFAGSAIGGTPVSGLASGLHAGANLIVVIEAHYYYSLNPVPFTYNLSATPVPGIQNGGSTNISVGAMPFQELTWFQAKAGQIVRMQVDNADLSLSSVERDLSAPRNPLCSPCNNTVLDYQAAQSGIVYVQAQSASAASSFAAAITLMHTTPEDIEINTPISAKSLDAQGRSFLVLKQSDPSWTLLEAAPTAFGGELEVHHYNRRRSGFLDIDVVATKSQLLASGESVTRIANVELSSNQRELLRVSDTAFDGSADTESFDLLVSNQEVAPLPLNAGQFNLTNLAIEADARHYYLVDAHAGERIEFALSNLSLVDLAIEVLASDASSLQTTNLAGVGGGETMRYYMPAGVDLAVAIHNLGATGTYDLLARKLVPNHILNGTGDTAVVPGAGMVSEQVTQATSCSIESIAVDIDIAGSNIGDMQVTLRSPQGTSIVLHDLSGGNSDNLRGSYPGTLTPAANLDLVLLEEAQGEWQLQVQTSTFAKSIQPWQLRLYCAP